MRMRQYGISQNTAIFPSLPLEKISHKQPFSLIQSKGPSPKYMTSIYLTVQKCTILLHPHSLLMKELLQVISQSTKACTLSKWKLFHSMHQFHNFHSRLCLKKMMFCIRSQKDRTQHHVVHIRSSHYLCLWQQCMEYAP